MGENSKKLDFIFKKLPGQKDPTGSDPDDDDEQEQEEEELELNLNLGLSLGGRFGVDKNKLVRSSSIAAILPAVTDNSSNKFGSGHGFGSGQGLARTASLPVETEEEWRKRKEVQSLRRLAAKRRRSEKQKSLGKFEREEYVADMVRVGSSVGPGFGSGNWDFGGGGGEKSDGGSVPGSFESQASTVSNVQGSSTEGEVSPASVQSSQERNNQDGSSSSRSKVVDPVVPPSRPKTENPTNNKGKEIRSNTFDMPCVFTQGDGPSGRRIEGILYKYGKGEEVKIMCVCHGSFLSPAEFVMHAGGTDIVHPLKHIVVNPNSSTYL